MNKIISFGGGVNSVAMVIMLYKRGEIYPCVFADTMAEHPETYCYMDYFEREFMGKYGQKIVRIDPYDNPEYYNKRAKGKGLLEYCREKGIVPRAFQGRWCSEDWKQIPLDRKKKEMGSEIMLAGIAYDERNRVLKHTHILNEYPLIDSQTTRNGCIEIIQNEGLSVPRKSGCFLCPLQRMSGLYELWEKYQDLFDILVHLDDSAYAITTGNKLRLLPSGIPVKIIRERFEAKGGELFPDYDYEELTPCMCIT